MKKIHKILTGLLVFQVALIALVNINWTSASAKAGESLLSVPDQSAIDQILITQDNKDVVIASDGTTWSLSDMNKLPASEQKISGVLDDLVRLKKTWPVAKTTSAAGRFEVAEDKFNKRVVLKNGDDTLTTLYLGTSPGYKRVHLRIDDEDEIYSAAINGYDISGTAVDWLDKGLLKQQSALLSSLTFNDLTLQKDGTAWRLADQADNEEPNTEEINKVTDFITNLQVTGLLEQDKVKTIKVLKPAIKITTTVDQNEVSYFAYIHENDAAVKSSLRDEWFKMAKHSVDNIKDLQRADFVKEKTAPASTDGDANLAPLVNP